MIGYGNGTPCVCGEKNTWHKKCYQNQAKEMKQLQAQLKAAEEIERLREEVERLSALCDKWNSECDEYREENKKLCAELAQCKQDAERYRALKVRCFVIDGMHLAEYCYTYNKSFDDVADVIKEVN